MVNDEESAATTMAEVAGQAGIRKYLWLYFLIVPLAATTASTVAVMIAALQGLGEHDLASRLYALIVVVGVKTLLCIAAAYLLSLLLASFSVWVFSNRIQRFAYRVATLRFPPAQNERQRADIEMEKAAMRGEVQSRLRRYSAFQTATLVFSVFYGAVFLAAAMYWYAAEGYFEAYDLLNQIAFPTDLSPADSPSPPQIDTE